MAKEKKRKKFFDVEIPLIRKETHLQAYDIKELEGRTIKYDLTRFLKGKGMIIKLNVKIEGEKATTTPKETRFMPYFLKRMVRKGTNYVEDSFSTKCTDAQIRIKPFLITRRKVSRAVRKALREKAREELINYVKDKNTETLFDEILKNQLQKSLILKLKKIYPLSLCEIRVLKVEKEFDKKEK
jgi:ribosomal protein S3AE|tara:strand:+ start:553 stop:1104 length:552 start_codon:yes stop_codon:yes gene_type:complete